jgi:hypothetical protein
MGANQSNPQQEGQEVPTAAGVRTRTRRRREAAKAFYLVFGEPHIRYTGGGRGPLIFHVQTPAAEQVEAVDAADTLCTPVALSTAAPPRVELVPDDRNVSLLFSVVASQRAHVRVLAGGRVVFEPGRGVSIPGATVVHVHEIAREAGEAAAADVTTAGCIDLLALDQQGALSPTSDENVAPLADATIAARARALGVPEINTLCIAIDFDVASKAAAVHNSPAAAAANGNGDGFDDRLAITSVEDPTSPSLAPPPPAAVGVPAEAVPCTAFYFLRVERRDEESAVPAVVVACSLLMRRAEVYKIDNVFDPGRDASPRRTGDEEDGEGSDDDDELCVICLTNPKDTVVLPCRHLCMCSECAQVLRGQNNSCPMCRTGIERLMKRV